MKIFQAVKNFFCEEEKPEPAPMDEPLINAADLFPVHVASNSDFMGSAVARAKMDNEIRNEVQAGLSAEAVRMKTDLSQGKAPAPAPVPEETRPDWQTVSDEL